MPSQSPIEGHSAEQPSPNPDGTAIQSDTDAMDYDSIWSNDIVTILVGPEKVKYPIHKSVLTFTSEFFKSTFSGPRTNLVLQLPHEEPCAFGIFVGWAYAQPIAALNAQPVKVLGPPIKNSTTIRSYLALYILAEKYVIESLQNEVMDIIHEYSTTAWGFSGASATDMEFVYKKALPHSKLLRFLTHQWSKLVYSGLLCRGDRAELMERYGGLAVEILREIADAKLSGRQVPSDQVLPRCDYHVHKITPKCQPTQGIEPSSTALPGRGGRGGAYAASSSPVGPSPRGRGSTSGGLVRGR